MYWITCVPLPYRVIIILFLILSIKGTIYNSHSSSAICFLTRQPAAEIVQFALQLAQRIPSSIDVFIVVDDNTVTLPLIASSTLRFLQFNESVCTNDGFQKASTFSGGKGCSAWDKALYYFSKVSIHHSFVWFVEDDVFIPSVQAFISLHELYSSSYDLVTPGIMYNTDGHLGGWQHWSLAAQSFVLPWVGSMACAMGCSRRLLTLVDEYAQWRGQLAFIEFFFHILAIQDSRMKIVAPPELITIVYSQEYTFEAVQSRPNNWWHPMKTRGRQPEWRDR
jgi:hypothetical protein